MEMTNDKVPARASKQPLLLASLKLLKENSHDKLLPTKSRKSTVSIVMLSSLKYKFANIWLTTN